MLFLAGFLEHVQKGFLSTFLYVLSSMYHQEVRQREKTLISNVIPEQVQEASLLQIDYHVIVFQAHFWPISPYKTPKSKTYGANSQYVSKNSENWYLGSSHIETIGFRRPAHKKRFFILRNILVDAQERGCLTIVCDNDGFGAVVTDDDVVFLAASVARG